MTRRAPVRRGKIGENLKYVTIGLLVTTLLVAAKILIESQAIGHEAEIWAFRFLQGQLTPFKSDEYLPVLVLDKSEISVGNDGATSRETLKRLIEAIAAYHPAAIGIDIDFSPRPDGWVTADDPDFFDFCLKVRDQKATPIFLGVFRAMEEPSNTWLGLERYRDLAAAIGLPDDTSRVPRWIQVEGKQNRLPTMSTALSQTYNESVLSPAKFLAWAIEMTSDNYTGVKERFGDKFEIVKTVVNYSKLEQIQHETISCTKDGLIAEPRDRFLHKMVIIGIGTRGKFADSFIVPGRNSPVAGVYVHACATYSLAVDQLYELKRWVRLALDFAISGFIIFCVAGLRFRNENIDSFQPHKWHGKFVTWAVVFTIVGGIILVRWLNVIWLDFFLVVFALLLHPTVEGRFDKLWKRLRDGKPKSPEREQSS